MYKILFYVQILCFIYLNFFLRLNTMFYMYETLCFKRKICFFLIYAIKEYV